MNKISSGFSLHFLKTKIQVGILIPYKISAGKAIIETYKILILYYYNNRTQILKNRVVKETPSNFYPVKTINNSTSNKIYKNGDV